MVLVQKREKTQSSPSPDAELQYYVKIFDNSSIGLRTRAVSAAFGAELGQKAGNYF